MKPILLGNGGEAPNEREFWIVDGEVYGAPAGSGFDSDGKPMGRRWECNLEAWIQFRETVFAWVTLVDEKYSIFPVTMSGGRIYFSIQTTDKRQKYGDPCMETLAGAITYAEEEEKRNKANEEFYRRQNERIALEEQREAERVAPLNSYLDSLGLTPMRRGKLFASLEVMVAYRSGGTGKSYSGFRWVVMSAMVADGWIPKSAEIPAIKEPTRRRWNQMDNRQQDEWNRKHRLGGTKTEYFLEWPGEGYQFVVTKVEFDLAKHLSEVKA